MGKYIFLSFFNVVTLSVLAVSADKANKAGDICSNNSRSSVKSLRIDVIISGKISEFFGETSSLIEVIKIYRGDKRYETNFVIVEGFRNCVNTHKSWRPFKIGDVRLIFAEKVRDGVFRLQSPTIPTNVPNLRRTYQKFGKRHLAPKHTAGKF